MDKGDDSEERLRWYLSFMQSWEKKKAEQEEQEKKKKSKKRKNKLKRKIKCLF